MPTNPLPPALVSGALIALLRDAQQLRAFVDDLVDVGGEERRGPYSAQAKWQNVKLRAAKLVESASAALSASRTPTTPDDHVCGIDRLTCHRCAPTTPTAEDELPQDMRRELRAYLDTLSITSDNIGGIRRALFMPWDSVRNGFVRDETAKREIPTFLPSLKAETREEE